MYDYTLNYDMTFYCGGGFICLAGVILFLVPAVRGCLRKRPPVDPFPAVPRYNTAPRLHLINELRETEREMVANTNIAPNASLIVKNGETAL